MADGIERIGEHRIVADGQPISPCSSLLTRHLSHPNDKPVEQASDGNGGQRPSFASLWTSNLRRATLFDVRQKMKKLVIFALLLIVGVVFLVFRARITADFSAMRHDPSTLKLRGTYPPLIQSTSISSGLQTGIVALPDGEEVKFWFVSHHVAGPGCTRFDFRDGTRRYMTGSYFCCEVQIPDQDVKNRSDLIAFIKAHHES